ncbi:peptidase S8/S53 domain-containing protein [Desarmillaria tabescens]|uniref:Peptidase S8/S53 domain-containing protein n=1 Tax=Armillaria tabescens TaxID=1929756 RepID=A0AA39JYT7_ARMTA|nr:peptidase S8/S53 domain-containing protein [Desarmillaria tabescens]KAK0451334.1 peptidase S8/S53 domain-containing protein [Desarmillaria tabescens]
MSTVIQSTIPQSAVTQAERVLRHRLQGGFLISPETTLEWASRLSNKPVTKFLAAWQVIDLRVGRMGARFSMVGEVMFGQFMVVTQIKRFRHGYLGMDPAKIPQFTEGAPEAIARKMLEEEGIHEPLDGGYGPGCKIIGGYDFVGDGEWPYGDAAPDDDPMDDIGHGTHVSGLIIGNSSYFVGVVPEAKMMMYKVFGKYDITYTDVLVAAFVRAYQDGVDIITSSISRNADEFWPVVASRLVDKGVFVSIAAENSGSAGPFYASNGAARENVVAVASVENSILVAEKANLTFQGSDPRDASSALIGYLLASTDDFPVSIKEYPIAVLSYNQSNPAEACEAYPAGTGDYSNYTVMVRRGTYTFAEKLINVEVLGARYILFYNNDGPMVNPDISSINYNSTSALITAETGAKIIEEIQAGKTVVMAASGNSSDIVGLDNDYYGALPNYFTSWGPLYDLTMKPEIAAPGGDILSTYLNDEYAFLSGTSMATPYIAGVAAAYAGKFGGKQSQGTSFGKTVAKRIVTSGYALPWTNYYSEKTTGVTASAAQVGAGMVDAGKVLHYTSSVDTLKIQLNDTANFQGEHDITVTNSAWYPVFYSLSTLSDGAVDTIDQDDGTILPFYGFGEPRVAVPGVKFSPSFLIVWPYQSSTVHVSFTTPDVDSSTMPLYSGRVVISSSVGEEISIPYLGLAGDLRNTEHRVMNKPWWTFDLPNQDFPIFYVAVRYAVTELRFDIYEPGYTEDQWEYPPVVGQNGYVGTGTTYNSITSNNHDPNVDDPTDVSAFPVNDLTRNGGGASSYHEYWWFGALGNGSDIANGQYHFRIAALNPFGDRRLSSDWSIWVDGMPDIVTVNRTITDVVE